MVTTRLLSPEELSAVVGGGIVDTVAADAEAATNAFLKNSAETAQKFKAFIAAGNQAPAPAAE